MPALGAPIPGHRRRSTQRLRGPDGSKARRLHSSQALRLAERDHEFFTQVEDAVPRSPVTG